MRETMKIEAMEQEIAKKYFPKTWIDQLDWESLKDMKKEMLRHNPSDEEWREGFEWYFRTLWESVNEKRYVENEASE